MNFSQKKNLLSKNCFCFSFLKQFLLQTSRFIKNKYFLACRKYYSKSLLYIQSDTNYFLSRLFFWKKLILKDWPSSLQWSNKLFNSSKSQNLFKWKLNNMYSKSLYSKFYNELFKKKKRCRIHKSAKEVDKSCKI